MNTKPFKKTKNKENLFSNTLIPQRNKFISDLCELTISRLGQRSLDADVIDIAILDSQKLIELTYPWYSLEEIEEVFKLGSFGELGDNMFFSSKTVAAWFRTYHNETRKKIAAKAKEEDALLALPEPDNVLFTIEDARKHEKEAREDYFAGHETRSWTYDILDKYGILKLTVEQKHAYIKKAKPIVKMEMHKRKAKGAYQFENISNVISSDMTSVKSCAKRLAVADYFEGRL